MLNKGFVRRDNVVDKQSDTLILNQRISKRAREKECELLNEFIMKKSQLCPTCHTVMKYLKSMDNDTLWYCNKCNESHWLWEKR